MHRVNDVYFSTDFVLIRKRYIQFTWPGLLRHGKLKFCVRGPGCENCACCCRKWSICDDLRYISSEPSRIISFGVDQNPPTLVKRLLRINFNYANMKAIFAVMNATWVVVKIRPEKISVLYPRPLRYQYRSVPLQWSVESIGLSNPKYLLLNI